MLCFDKYNTIFLKHATLLGTQAIPDDTLVSVHDELLHCADLNISASSILFDLSAAFDTVKQPE